MPARKAKVALPSARIQGRESQPVSSVIWVKRDILHGNSYNPNHVAPIEMTLLKISILEDGWTQPIVARLDEEIVDGFHRWMCSADPLISAMTDGYVPVVYLAQIEKEHQIMSTIRHNRARGSHAILKMAEIVRSLIDDEGLPLLEVQTRLQMDEEEVSRLYDRGGVKRKVRDLDFNEGWIPAYKAVTGEEPT